MSKHPIYERVIICGSDERPGPRDECPNAVHDWPCPSGYVAHSEVAGSRLYRGWTNKRCPICLKYGWQPSSKRDPISDIFTPYLEEIENPMIVGD